MASATAQAASRVVRRAHAQSAAGRFMSSARVTAPVASIASIASIANKHERA